MSPVTAQILEKLKRIEQVSPTTLEFILDFVSYLESRLELDSETNQDSNKTYLAFELDNLDAAYAEMAANEKQELEASESTLKALQELQAGNGEVFESPDELFTT